MHKKIVAVIQARLGSTRLPYKMMLSLHGRPIIEWVVLRVLKARLLDDIVVAIPDSEENDVLEKYLARLEVDVYRGQEHDVLNRIYNAAKLKQATHVVRVCADNPLISGAEIDNLIDYYLNNPCDYAYNGVPRGNTYPDGLGAEIVPFPMLEQLEKIVTRLAQREHCFAYITENQEQFIVRTFNPPNCRVANPELKLDIDCFEDYYHMSLKDFELDTPDEMLVEIFSDE